MQRPASLTFICYLHIGFYLLISLATIFSPEIRHSVAQEFESQRYFGFEMLFAIVFMVAMLAACLLMLKGNVLGRTIYVIASVVSFLDLVINTEVFLSTLPSLLIRLFIFYFLFRQPANQYFSVFSAPKNVTPDE